jgi:hypothetical protein
MQPKVVAEKVYLVTALVQNLGPVSLPVFTAIAARRIYIYIAATAGIEYIHFYSSCCNVRYTFLRQLLPKKYKMIYFFAAIATV